MEIEITLHDNSILKYQPGLPVDFKGPILKGAKSVWSKSGFTEIVLQQLTGINYFIRVTTGKLLKNLTIKSSPNNFGLHSNFALKNEVRKDVKTIGKFHLREDQFICYFTGESQCRLAFEAGEAFRTIDFFYTPKLLKELVPFYPELEKYLSKKPTKVLNGKGGWVSLSMKEITNQILNCPYDKNTRQFYYDLKVRELLYELLETSFRSNAKFNSFTQFETAKIHEARTILEKHIDKKPPSIKSLSRQVALNEFKLKTGFRKYFNSGIFEWLIARKMCKAKKLILNTNKPIKEIAALIGYPRTTNFITAFRRHFGYTPGSLRR